MAEIDNTIKEYAATLQDIYDARTAGDYTFVGVLADFAKELKRQECQASHWWQPTCPNCPK